MQDAIGSGANICLTGGYGTGRTTVLERLQRWAIESGRRVLPLRPSSTIQPASFGAFATADRAYGCPTDRSPVEHAAELAESLRDTLVIVDDAHLLDDASAHTLEQLLESDGTQLVVSVPNDIDLPDWLLRLAGRLDADFSITGLDRDTTHALALELLGKELDPWSSRRLHDRSGGSPLLICALVDQAERESLVDRTGPAAVLTGDPPLPESLRRAIDARRGATDPNDRLVIDLLGYVPRLPVSILENLVGPAALGRLEKRELIVAVGGESVTLGRSTLVASATTAVGPLRRRELARTLLDQLDGVETTGDRRLALGLAQAALGQPIDDLERVARHFESIGRDDELIEICYRSFDGNPPAVGYRVIADAHMRQGRYDDADKALEDAIDFTNDESERYVLIRARAAARDILHQASEGPAEALEAGVAKISKPNLASQLTREIALVNAFDGTWPSVREAAETALAGPNLDDRVRLDLSAILCTARLLAGPLDGLSDRMRSDLDRFSSVEAPSTRSVSWLLAYDLAAAYEGQITGSLLALRSTAENLRRFDHETAAWATFGVGQIALLAGKVETAYTHFHAANARFREYDPMRMLAAAIGLEAHAAALAGEARAATLLITEYDEEHRGRPGSSPLPVDRAKAAILASAGDLDAACAQLAAAAEVHIEPSPVWAALAYSDLTRMGNPRADEMAAIADVVGGDLIPALAAHARSLEQRSEAGLLFSATRLEELGANLDAAEAASQSARIHRELNPGAELTLTNNRIRRLHDAAEGARMFSNVRSLTSLTPREREITECLSRGLTDKGIADELDLSPRTVSNYLGRLYKKLSLANRDELGEWYRSSHQPAAADGRPAK